MGKRNKVQFQPGVSVQRFLKQFGTEAQCREQVFRSKWPTGYKCPRCTNEKSYYIETRALFQCAACRHQTSLLSGTIFASSKLPLTTWFLAIYFVSQSKEGIPALKLMRLLGISDLATIKWNPS